LPLPPPPAAPADADAADAPRRPPLLLLPAVPVEAAAEELDNLVGLDEMVVVDDDDNTGTEEDYVAANVVVEEDMDDDWFGNADMLPAWSAL